jgi:hypothetical protein
MTDFLKSEIQIFDFKIVPIYWVRGTYFGSAFTVILPKHACTQALKANKMLNWISTSLKKTRFFLLHNKFLHFIAKSR